MGTGGTSAPKTPDIQFSEVLLPKHMTHYITEFGNVKYFFQLFSIFLKKVAASFSDEDFHDLADIDFVVILRRIAVVLDGFIVKILRFE